MYMAVNTLDAKKGKKLVDMLNNFRCRKEDCTVGCYEESFCAFLWCSIADGINIMDWLMK